MRASSPVAIERPAAGSTPAGADLHRFWLSTLACALVAAATANGFFLVARPVLVAVLPAFVAALIVERFAETALSCAAGTAAGVALAPMAPPGIPEGPWALCSSVAIAAASAAGATMLLRLVARRITRRPTAILTMSAIAFCVFTMTWTGWEVAQGPRSGTPSLAASLRLEPAPGSYWSDESIYSRVMHLTDGGNGYYSSVRIAWNQKAFDRGDPQGVFSFRLPTLFWMASLLPGGPSSLVAAMLAFGALAVVAAYGLASRYVLPGYALVGSTLVAIFYTREASSSHLLQAEPWAAALALAGAAAWAGALTAAGERSRLRRTWLAAGLCLGAALFREHLVWVPLAACMASVGLPEERARRAWLPWSVVTALYAGALGAHAIAAAAHTTGPILATRRWIAPGFQHLAAAIDFGQDLVGGLPWMPWLIAVLAVAGAVAARPIALRVFLSLVCIGPLLGFLVLRPPGVLPGGGQPGYWGASVIPLLCGTVPFAFAWIPCARSKARWHATLSVQRSRPAP